MTDKLIDKLIEKINSLTDKDLDAFLVKENLDTLKKVKEYTDDIYYNTGESSGLTDEQYDKLAEAIAKRDKQYYVKVGSKIRENDNRVELPYWMGSMDKIRTNEELQKWLTKNKHTNYVIEKKLDGVSALLLIEKGQYKLYTRGDGYIGADISYLVPYFTTIPKNIKENIVIRGELIMDKNIFAEKYGAEYKNPRNFVSGRIGGKTVREGLEDIEFIAYEIVSDTTLSPYKQLMKLQKMGFEIVYWAIDQYHNMTGPLLVDRLVYLKGVTSYEIDGLIIQPDRPYERNTSGNPSYAVAFKPASVEDYKTTSVINVEWNVSKHGFLKPVINIEPVKISGVTVKRATAYNAKYIKDNSIGPGAIVKIVRSGEVIPKIIDVVVSAPEPQMPDLNYKWNETNVDILVELGDEDDENQYSETMCVKLIAGFFSKLGIKHVSEATVSKLYNHGYDSLLKIIAAEKEDFETIEGFGERLAERTYDNIHAGLQNISIPLVLGASSIFGFGLGERKLVVLFEAIPNLLDIYKKLKPGELYQKIMNVEGFSDKTVEKVVANIEWADLFIKALSHFATFKSIVKEKVKGGSLDGKKVVMSGFRDKKLQEEIESKGGKVTTSVSSNTNILIVADKNELSGKIQKAIDLGIDIYDKKEFIKKFM